METKTIKAIVTYSRQMPETVEHSVYLLSQLEKATGLKNLSVMREPSEILRRLYEGKVKPVIEENTHEEFFHVF